MSISLGSAVVTIEANTALLASGISGAKVLMADFAVSAAGAAGAVLDLGAKFQQQNTMLITSAGEAQSNLKLISDGVLQTSIATGTSTDQLEAAMYKIESSGQHGKAALTDLAAAAEGAKLENSNLADVANAEMTVMTDYASKHITAAQAVNDLIATVAHGRANIQDMSLAMSTVLPTANAVGVSLYDTSAALAVMTARGTDAASAATYLKQMLIALDAPSSKATKTLADIGLSTQQVSDEMKVSLPGALALIEDHLKAKFPEGSAAYVAALKDISGGSRTMQGILQLTGSSLQTFTQDAKDVAAAVQDGGSKIDGWALAQQNFATKMDQAKAAVDAFGIKIGTALLPVVGTLVTDFQNVLPLLNQLFDAFTIVTTPTQQASNAVSQVATQVSNLVRVLDPATGMLKLHTAAQVDATTKTADVTAAYTRHTETTRTLMSATERSTDALDKNNNSFTETATQAKNTQDAMNPFVTTVKNLVTEAQNIGSVFQHTVLPPLEKLGGDVLTLVGHFGAWLQSSNLLNLAVHDVADTLGGLISGVDTFVGWLDKGGPGVTAFAIALGTIGTAIAGIKLAEFGAGIYNAVQKLTEGNGIIANMAGNAMPNLNKAFGWTKVAAQDTSDAIAKVAPAALTAAEQAKADFASLAASFDTAQAEVATDTALMETHIEGVGTAAVTASGESGIGKIAPAVETAEAEVKTQSGFMSGALAAVGGPTGVGIIITALATLGPAAYQAGQDMKKNLISQIDDMIAQAKAKKGEMNAALAYQASLQIDILRAQYGLQSQQQEAAAPYNNSASNVGPFQHHAAGGTIAPFSYGLVGEQGPELVYNSSASGVGVLPNAQTMAWAGDGRPIEVHVHTHNYIDSREVTGIIMNRAVSEIRRATGVRR